MLSVSGVGIIDPKNEIKEVPISNNQFVYFNFRIFSKDAFKTENHYYQVNVLVPIKELEIARKSFIPNRCIYIRLGELKGVKVEKNNKEYIFTTISAKYSGVEFLNASFDNTKKLEG